MSGHSRGRAAVAQSSRRPSGGHWAPLATGGVCGPETPGGWILLTPSVLKNAVNTITDASCCWVSLSTGSLLLGGWRGGSVICALVPAVTPFRSPSVHFSGQKLLLLLLGPGLGLHLSPKQSDQPAWWGSISNSLLVLRSSCSALHQPDDWLRLTFMTNQLIGLV